MEILLLSLLGLFIFICYFLSIYNANRKDLQRLKKRTYIDKILKRR